MSVVSAAVALVLLAPTAQPPTKAAPVDVKGAVAKGLKWLAEQQKPDGSWVGTGDGYQTYMTGHAGVALLMEGSTLTRGTYAPNLRNALAWVEKNAAATGLIGGTHETELTWDVTGHAAALVFLVCIYDVDDDEPRRGRVAKLIERAIAFTAECQSATGGWGYISGQKSDGASYPTTATLQALFAARNAGFAVPKRITERTMRYLVAPRPAEMAECGSNAATEETEYIAPDRTATPARRHRRTHVRRAAAPRRGAVDQEGERRDAAREAGLHEPGRARDVRTVFHGPHRVLSRRGRAPPDRPHCERRRTREVVRV